MERSLSLDRRSEGRKERKGEDDDDDEARGGLNLVAISLDEDEEVRVAVKWRRAKLNSTISLYSQTNQEIIKPLIIFIILFLKRRRQIASQPARIFLGRAQELTRSGIDPLTFMESKPYRAHGLIGLDTRLHLQKPRALLVSRTEPSFFLSRIS